MLTLLDEFAPFTSSIGFARASVDAVAEARVKALAKPTMTASELDDDFPAALAHLLPGSPTGHRRELLVGCGEWTAVFMDAISDLSLHYIASLGSWLTAEVVGVQTVPDTATKADPSGRWGGVVFSHWHPEPAPEGAKRTVQVSNQSGSWVFVEVGEPLDFEDTDRYQARAKCERLTSDMVDRYCRTFGISPFDADFYQGPCRLVGPSGRPDDVESGWADVHDKIGWKAGQAAKAEG